MCSLHFGLKIIHSVLFTLVTKLVVFGMSANPFNKKVCLDFSKMILGYQPVVIPTNVKHNPIFRYLLNRQSQMFSGYLRECYNQHISRQFK
jgi:hypothetical protein